MSSESRIGVYICHPAGSDQGVVDLQAVAEYAAQLSGVVVARVMPVPRRLDPEGLAAEMRQARLNAVVLAGDSPGFYKPAFARALSLAGGDPEQVRQASFREHGAVSDRAAGRAKAVLACAVYGVPFTLAAEPGCVPVQTDTLVIGAGIAGIQAALEIADAGYKVHMIERAATIGGHMAMFDKTFPTLDCAACILTPKMVVAGKHPNIHLMVLSEVQEVSGGPGAYQVKVLKHTPRVDAEACTACGECAQFCPVSVTSEFDAGIATRKAIYLSFPQAVPNAYAVDPRSCLWIQSDGKKCGACVKKCGRGAVCLDAKDEIVELNVGNIIAATGYDVLDARRVERYGYGIYPNVLTALEFERLSNASGPTAGKIVLKTKRQNKRTKTDEWVFDTDGPKPKTVAIIHCVGSRDHNYNPYCSRVCCMYSLKFAHLVREKLPEAKCYEYYIDMRAFGKGYEEFFERIKEEGVCVVRGRSAEVIERDGQMFARGEDIVADQLTQVPVDMVLLAVGMTPAAGSVKLAEMLGIDQESDGWFNELNYNTEPNMTERGGIFVAGVCQGPKDIPDTVAQASAAAAKVLRAIVGGKVQQGRADLTVSEIEAKAQVLAQL
ncbi:MAG: CoB--CoM heterodisulfide reductase iron-sulfur subunit A family protein [Acidobacteriia bacterium]|nr:CoB--CoM heterodisulfide reductase iron-sulfur subunit A family protein [Terriglobia bacterium]